MTNKNNHFLYTLLSMFLLLALLSACGSPNTSTPPQSSPTLESPIATATPIPATATVEPSPEPTIEPTPEPSPTPTPILYRGHQSINTSNANDLELLATLGGTVVQDLAWNKSGQTLAVCTLLGLDVFSLDPFEKIHHLNNNIPCNTMAWSPDGNHLALNLPDGKVQFLAPSTWEVIQTLETNLSAIHDLAWSPDGKQLAVGATNGTALIFTSPLETSSAKPLIIPSHVYGRVPLAWSNDSKQLLAANEDGRLTLWDTQDASMLLLFEGHNAAIINMVCSPEGTQFATVS